MPLVPAMVLAVLVALAATVAPNVALGDGLGFGVAGPLARATGRPASPLGAPGRLLASALTTVADQLEDDWNGAARRASLRVLIGAGLYPGLGTGLIGYAASLASSGSVLSLATVRADPLTAVAAARSAYATRVERTATPIDPERHLRRIATLSPPSDAFRMA
jgi:hypothetical protein